MGVYYATYTLDNARNKYWYWLTGFTLLSAFISFIESLLFNSSISDNDFAYIFAVDRYAIITITVIQMLLIIMATNGYRREVGSFVFRAKGEWIRANCVLRASIGNKNTEEDKAPP